MSGTHGSWRQEIPLVGPGGERVHLGRTLLSHGVASLPPMFVDEGTPALEVTLPVPRARPRVVRVEPAGVDLAVMSIAGRRPGAAAAAALTGTIRHILRLDEDLSPFYDVCRDDPDLAWVCAGAGRMIRSATVFEEVVKTICTTNCAWSATERMVGALVEHLGERAVGAPNTGVRGRTFPSPDVMATTDEDFYKSVVRAGYRSAYLISLARSVTDGTVRLEEFDRSHPAALSDEEVEERLLALPGVGPYAASHIMMMLGRYSRLILDSWTRPTYARIAGYKSVKDSTIQRRWSRYGTYAGLAFWLYLTRSWVEDEVAPT
ncbi:MAG: Fe-S cluster assembly protein HesB [Actinomycetota bacterium]|nr:Fe-S cluster assembly protein HesB [Actinomycetota bacterium]